jgi:hypothetical protein
VQVVELFVSPDFGPESGDTIGGGHGTSEIYHLDI